MSDANQIDVKARIRDLALINILIVTGGLLIWRVVLPVRYNAIIVIISFLLPLINYFGIITIFESLNIGLEVNKGAIRTAMVSAILVLFFFAYPVSLFINFGEEKFSDFAREMTQNFTYMLTVMIPFYFAASAYVQTHESSKNNGNDKKGC